MLLPSSLPKLWRTATRLTEGWPLLRIGEVLQVLRRHSPLLGCQERGWHPKGLLWGSRWFLVCRSIPEVFLMTRLSSIFKKVAPTTRISRRSVHSRRDRIVPQTTHSRSSCRSWPACPPCCLLMSVMRPWSENPTYACGSKPHWAHCRNILRGWCRVAALLLCSYWASTLTGFVVWVCASCAF